MHMLPDLAKLESKADGQLSTSSEVRRIRKELTKLFEKTYSNLTAWETVQVSRHANRPQTVARRTPS